MPLYTYRCECGEEIQVRHAMDAAPLTSHDGCGGYLRRVLSAAPIHFGTKGFYCTDNRRPSAPPAGSKNSWEKGIALDHRGVPYLGEDHQPIGVKRFAEGRSKYEERIRRLHNDPAPFPARS